MPASPTKHGAAHVHVARPRSGVAVFTVTKTASDEEREQEQQEEEAGAHDEPPAGNVVSAANAPIVLQPVSVLMRTRSDASSTASDGRRRGKVLGDDVFLPPTALDASPHAEAAPALTAKMDRTTSRQAIDDAYEKHQRAPRQSACAAVADFLRCQACFRLYAGSAVVVGD